MKSENQYLRTRPLTYSTFLDIRSVDVLIDNLNNIRIGMKNYEDSMIKKEEN